MAIEMLSNGSVRRIIRIRIWPRYIRFCVGHDSGGNDTRSYFGGACNWHMRLTQKAYICIGSY